MDVRSKKLDHGAVEHVFKPHPLCYAPLVTHLNFADDLLIFFYGSEDSLTGILSILEDFRKVSGLGINKDKSFLFLDGGDLTDSRQICDSHGISQGSFPVLYLGVSLTTKR